jgi:hypoxanthine phosphoribosyltransferase
VVQRQFDYQRVWQLTLPMFERAGTMIAEAAPRADVVVGIARGGIPLAELVAERLGLQMVPLRVRHNLSDEIYLPASGDVRITTEDAAPLASAVEGRQVLVADDICGTGATLKAVLDRMLAMQPAAVRSAVLCRSEAADFTIWLWNTRNWVVFPWNDPVAQPTEVLELPRKVQRCRR